MNIQVHTVQKQVATLAALATIDTVTTLASKPTQAEILRPAEWVFPGHPDKLADAVAEQLVFEASKREARALCGLEVAVHRDRVYLTGRIACEGSDQIDLLGTVQEVYRRAGYGERWKPAP